MPGPAIVAGLAAAAKVAARNYAKDLAKKEAAKTVTKKVATKSVAKTAPKTSSAGKLDKKLNQLDRRSKAVAPKKKYSDMTPAEKRKWDSLNAETVKTITKKAGKK
jgi:hypothetical protein